jgi:hypothetical protein
MVGAPGETEEVLRFAPCVEWPIARAPVPSGKVKSPKTAPKKTAVKVIEAEAPTAVVVAISAGPREVSRSRELSRRCGKWLASYAGAVAHRLAIEAGAFSVKTAIVYLAGTGAIGYTVWEVFHPPAAAVESGWKAHVRVAPGNPNRR